MVNAVDTDGLKQRLMAKARELGFVAVGFAPAVDDPLRARRLREWLAAGLHGDMEWMESRADVRQGPQAMWPEAKSVIALGMSYAPEIDPLALAERPEKARISVYAQGRDYHDTVKKALKALARWLVEQAPETELKVFVDTAPVMEKPLGEAAGIGWQGKHTNLVSREHGSWLFLGAIYTRLSFAPDLADLLALDDAAFRSKFSGSPIKRIGRNRFVRNCLIAAGNSGERGLAAQVGKLIADPDPVVAEAATWALHEILREQAREGFIASP